MSRVVQPGDTESGLRVSGHGPRRDERGWRRQAKAAFRRHYADLALMEDVLRDSDLDWTATRPPRLLNRPLTATYRTAYEQNVRTGMSISRADVAHLMLDAIDRP